MSRRLRSFPLLTLGVALLLGWVCRAGAVEGASGAKDAAAGPGPAPTPAASASAGAVPPAAGAPKPAAERKPLGDEVLVSAERVERREEGRLLIGEGAVVIQQHELRLAADRVVYHEETRDVVADGNVVLDSGPDRLQGEHLELNLETRIGFMEHAQGFMATYYFTGERIEKRGPDRYFLRNGSFTTCEGARPDWSFRSTSASVTVDEYLHAWNPTLRVKRLPVLYLPYAIFPVKRDRSTGLLIPEIAYSERDGMVLREAFYWAPRDNFDATIGIEYLQNTGWGANGEMRYLLAPRTQGVLESHYVQASVGDGVADKRWSVSSRNSHELPLGLHLEAEAFIQSDRTFTATYGNTIEERSNERTSSSFYLNRSWSAWDFGLSGRFEESLLTERRTTLTRFPELTVDRTSTRLFGSGLYLKLSAAAGRLERENLSTDTATTRLHLGPELTAPISLGTVARIVPTVSYALTYYSRGLDGKEETRNLPTYQLALEGPRAYRIWDLAGGRTEKIKHLVEPRISYVYRPRVDQANLPQFDSIDDIPEANRLEYSLTNTLYAKVRETRVEGKSATALPVVPPDPAQPSSAAAAADQSEEGAVPPTSTQELLWVKLSQSYSFADEKDPNLEERPFSPVEWDARTKPGGGIELLWKGDLDVYGKGIGSQNVSLSWTPAPIATLRAEWRSTRDSDQDFLDVGGELTLGPFGFAGRSRYNLGEETFVENRLSIKYSSQCWDVTVGYVDWTDTFEYSLLISLKGIGTVLKI